MSRIAKFASNHPIFCSVALCAALLSFTVDSGSNDQVAAEADAASLQSAIADAKTAAARRHQQDKVDRQANQIAHELAHQPLQAFRSYIQVHQRGDVK